jgi:hypothetical protein
VLRLNKFDTQVDIAALSPGIYFMRTETERVIQNISFIKK